MLMNKLVLNWWQESNKQVRGQLVPPQRSNPLGKQQQGRDGCLGSGDWRFIHNYVHKWWERQRFRPRWCSPLWVAVKYGSKTQEGSAQSGGCGCPPPDAADDAGWKFWHHDRGGWTKSHQWDQWFPRCLSCTDVWVWLSLAMLRWKPLHLSLGGSPRKKHILTRKPTLLEENTSVRACFDSRWLNKGRWKLQRQLSWRTQQGCVGWELKKSSTLWKWLIVP